MRVIINLKYIFLLLVLITLYPYNSNGAVDLDKKKSATAVQIVGGDQLLKADVKEEDGVKRLQVSTSKVQLISDSAANFLIEDFKTSTSTSSMVVNGSSSAFAFNILADQTGTFDKYIQRISCFVTDNGIKFGQYAAINTPLTNGILLTIGTNEETVNFPLIKTTDDLKHILTLGDPREYSIDIQSGRDDLMTGADFTPPIVLKANSTEFARFKIQDDLTSLIQQKCRAIGFKRKL